MHREALLVMLGACVGVYSSIMLTFMTSKAGFVQPRAHLPAFLDDMIVESDGSPFQHETPLINLTRWPIARKVRITPGYVGPRFLDYLM